MSVDEKITNAMTIREILANYPQTEEVFERHGLTECGGPQGPVEPVGFFAMAHQVDPHRLVEELNEAVGKHKAREADERQAREPRRHTEARPEPDIYRPFVKTAIAIALTVGCTLGAINLAAMAFGGSVGTTWAAITQAHGHAQIFGWVGLFIMGIAYQVVPRLKSVALHSRPLAMASFWLVLAGTLLRMVAQPFALDSRFALLVVTSSLAELAGAALFVYVIGRTMAASQAPADFFEKWLAASAVWFMVLAAATVGLAVYALQEGLDVVTGAWNAAYLHVGLMGFVGTMIFGVTLRTLPAFMGLRAPNKKAFDVLFWTFNVAVAARAGAIFLQGGWPGEVYAALELAASIGEYFSVLAFVYYLNVFRKPAVSVANPGLERGHEKFIKAAYGWLLVAATMSVAYVIVESATGREVPHALIGAYRHALTVGFISMMIVGMSARMMAVFNGVRLHSSRLLGITFVLLNAGNIMRVISQPLAGEFGGGFFVTMGLSGFVEVSALALYGYNIWRTMEARVVISRAEGRQEPQIRRDMLVLDVLERFPGTVEVFVKRGFTPLGDPAARRVRAQGVTIEMAAQVHSVNVDQLVEELNGAVGK